MGPLALQHSLFSYIWLQTGQALQLASSLQASQLFDVAGELEEAELGARSSEPSAIREQQHSNGSTVWNELQDSVYEGLLHDLRSDELPWGWRQQSVREKETCPPMFIAVMSRRDKVEKRRELRTMWKAMEGWGDVTAGFAVCTRHNKEESSIDAALYAEQQEHGDMFFLRCDEGYKDGLLTLKVLTAMRLFLENYTETLFMKIDDDSFVSPRRMCQLLSPQFEAHPLKYSYIGVFAEKSEHFGEGVPPCRDPANDWYEPEYKFADAEYPISAKGGPGYILSRGLVKKIVEQQIADSYLLNNEDKAVGVWVKEVIKQGREVRLLNMPGTDGYLRFHANIILSGSWATYPYAVHHNLHPDEITCLHKLDLAQDDGLLVDDCFARKRAMESSTNMLASSSSAEKLACAVAPTTEY